MPGRWLLWSWDGGYEGEQGNDGEEDGLFGSEREREVIF